MWAGRSHGGILAVRTLCARVQTTALAVSVQCRYWCSHGMECWVHGAAIWSRASMLRMATLPLFVQPRHRQVRHVRQAHETTGACGISPISSRCSGDRVLRLLAGWRQVRHVRQAPESRGVCGILSADCSEMSRCNETVTEPFGDETSYFVSNANSAHTHTFFSLPNLPNVTATV